MVQLVQEHAATRAEINIVSITRTAASKAASITTLTSRAAICYVTQTVCKTLVWTTAGIALSAVSLDFTEASVVFIVSRLVSMEHVTVGPEDARSVTSHNRDSSVALPVSLACGQTGLNTTIILKNCEIRNFCSCLKLFTSYAQAKRLA